VARGGVERDQRVLDEAEARLFGVLGLERHSRRVALADAPVEHVRVLETGDGPPVLFVHGAGMTAAVWAPVLVHLPHRRCICVDLPGCGLSDAFDHRGAELREHARTLLTSLLDVLGLDGVPVVANSLGATYALYLAATDATRVFRLVLFGAPGVALPGAHPSLAMRLYGRPRVGRMLSTLSPPITAGVARRILTSVCGRPAVAAMPHEMFEVVAAGTRIADTTIRTLMPELLAGGRPRPEHALSRDELTAITTPTRFVWGSDDTAQPPSAGRDATAAMPDAELVEVPGGHHPWWDDPQGCATLHDEHAAPPQAP
jgi:pimeloyl-ACP methyl ester carboxylesterase